ncbi:MAG: hypothetical protein ACD_29C00318G0002 [uncultured bacterium]|nr:MAG: hypothetical protein ACD_29C00318G0002 [uncultured bacterium]
MKTTLAITFSAECCHAAVLEQLSNGVVSKNKISITHDFDNKETLSKVISDLKLLYVKNMHVTVEIPAENSMMRDITVEHGLLDADIMRFLQSRATQLFGHAADQLCIDYEIHPEINDGKQKITVIAAHAALISNMYKSFARDKMMINTIHVNNKMNLLPWREMQKRKSKQKTMFGLIASSFLIIGIFITLKYFFIHETRLLKIQANNIIENNANIVLHHPHQHSALLQKLKSLHLQKLAAMKANQAIEILLSDIANDLPNSVTLSALTLNHKKIKLMGVGDQLSDIHQYSNALKQNLPWKNVQLSEIHNDQKNKLQMDFTIQVTP